MSSIVYVNTTEVTVDVLTATTVTVDVTYSSTEVEISNLQGPQGDAGVASGTFPIYVDDPTNTVAIYATSQDVATYVVQRDANQRFSIGAIDWDTNSTQSTAEARLYWNGNESLNLGLGGGNVTISIGQEVINYVTNAEATTLNVGEVVYLFGASGDRPSVKRASNTSDATSAKTFGIVAEAITAGGAGFVVKQGICAKINTLAYNPGDILWLSSTPGQFTTTKPVAPNHLVFVGVVLRSNAGNGLVYVSPQNGFELYELHDVLITTESDGQYLVYEAATDLWKNKSISATAPAVYNASTQVISVTDASTSAKGVVRLSSSTDSTSEVLAATPKAVKAAYDLADAAAPGTTTISATAPITSTGTLDTGVTIGVTVASTSDAGVVQLTDSISSTSTTTAATPNSVKTAYDLAAAAIPLTQKAAANGVATLDASGLVPTNQLPALAITNTFVVASQAAMLALTAETGDVAVRTDVNKSFILTATPASTLANWQELLTPPDAVSSVDGRTGTVTLSDLYAAKGITISTTSPLAGGGDLSANRTLSIADASTSVKGAVQLSSLTNSTSEILAATPKAVKDAYDLANTANTTANAAVPQTRTISTTAPLTGGGDLSANRTFALSTGSSLTVSASNLIVDSTIVPYLANANTFTASPQQITISTAANDGLIINAAASQSGDLTLWRDSSSNILARVSGSGNISAPTFTVTSATVPSNGIYLPTTNSVAIAAGASQAARFAPTGEVVIGSTAISTGNSLTVSRLTTGGTDASSVFISTSIQNDVTTIARAFNTFISTANSNFVLPTLEYFRAEQGIFSNITAGGSVTQQRGFSVGASLIDATNNFGFYGNIPSGTNRWNFYANGTAANYFAGQTTVGSTLLNLGASNVAQQFGVVSTSATNIGFVLRGATSQTGDLFQAQNSAATVLAKIDSSGNLFAPTLQSPTASKATLTMNGDTGGLLVATGADANKGLVLRRNSSSQSANLLEIQSQVPGTVAHITGFGQMGIRSSGVNSLNAISTSLLINSGSTTFIPLAIQMVASQTADAFQIANSASTILGGANALAQIYSGSTSPILVATGGATTAASGTGTTATITTTSAHGLAVGDFVTVAGVTPSGYNATALVTAVPSTTQISYANTTTGAQTVAGTVSAPAQASITSRSAGTVGQVIRAAFGQTANLQQWQNSAGTVLAKIDSTGRITVGVGRVELFPNSAAYFADGLTSDGAILTGSTMRASTGGIFGGTTRLSSAGLTVYATAAGNPASIIRGAASQTANLQEWQNSAGTVLTKIDSSGNIVAGNMAIATSSVSTVHISNGTIPSANPTGGGVLYVEAGALKYRGSSGTITTIANA